MDQTSSGIAPKEGWSWGGAMMNAYFLVAVKRYAYLWWFLLALIPFVNIVFWIVMFIYLGVNGHRISAGGTQFASQNEYDGFTKATDHGGKILFFVGIIIAVIGIIAFIAGFSILGWYGSHQPQLQTTTQYGSY